MNTEQMVFVFGSNTGGIHGAGAARFAYLHKGAVFGEGYGHYGNSYAIPTKRAIRVKGRLVVGNTLRLKEIEEMVKVFLKYTKVNRHFQFQITQIGCGLAGLKPEEIAPMFIGATKNCFFDTAWKEYLGDDYNYWGTM